MLTLQELSEFLRNAAYSDNMKHEIDWRLAVIHPRNNDGVVGFSGGIWHKHNAKSKENISMSISFDELNGITDFQIWRNGCGRSLIPFGRKPTFKEFKERVIQEFKIDELYEPKKRVDR